MIMKFNIVLDQINQKLKHLDKKDYIVVNLEDFAKKYNQEIKEYTNSLGIKNLIKEKYYLTKIEF